MTEFEIWIEGYAATGEHSTAHYYGKSSGKDFDEAMLNYKYPKDILSWDEKTILIHAGDGLNLDKEANGEYRRGSFRTHNSPNPELINPNGNYSSWACQFFDNETDARKSFG